MPSKPKYNYDIEEIAKLESDTENSRGLPVRAISRQKGWPEANTQQWINRNFKRTVKYEPRNCNLKK